MPLIFAAMYEVVFIPHHGADDDADVQRYRLHRL